MLIILTIFFASAAVVLWMRLRLLQKETVQITETIRRTHGKSSNEKITVSSGDDAVVELAGTINLLYEEIQEERARHSHEMKEMRDSLANISHDLRTPLTSIIGYVKLLQNGDNTPEQQEHYLAVIAGKSIFLNELINNLFTLTGLESGNYPFVMERLDIVEVLSEQLAGFYHMFTKDGNNPSIHIHEHAIWVTGDRMAYSRVFYNLMQNMVKHGGRDIRIATTEEADAITLLFSNEAPTLNETDVEQLFQRFFIADRMRSGEHTGLGLAIVRELVEQMGGSICAKLEAGILTFAISIKKE